MIRMQIVKWNEIYQDCFELTDKLYAGKFGSHEMSFRWNSHESHVNFFWSSFLSLIEVKFTWNFLHEIHINFMWATLACVLHEKLLQCNSMLDMLPCTLKISTEIHGSVLYQNVPSHGESNWAPPSNRLYDMYRGCGPTNVTQQEVVPRGPLPPTATPQPLPPGYRPQWLQEMSGMWLEKYFERKIYTKNILALWYKMSIIINVCFQDALCFSTYLKTIFWPDILENICLQMSRIKSLLCSL